MSQERSAEFYRGAKWQRQNGYQRWRLDQLLAEAEARETSVPTAANGTGTLTLSEAIAGLREACAGVTVSTVVEPTEADLAVADELDMLAAHIQEYIGPDDARDDIRRICRNRAEDLRHGVKRGPSAAQVIAAAEQALTAWREAMNTHGEWDDGCFYYSHTSASELEPRIERNESALALFDKYKEAHNA